MGNFSVTGLTIDEARAVDYFLTNYRASPDYSAPGPPGPIPNGELIPDEPIPGPILPPPVPVSDGPIPGEPVPAPVTGLPLPPAGEDALQLRMEKFGRAYVTRMPGIESRGDGSFVAAVAVKEGGKWVHSDKSDNSASPVIAWNRIKGFAYPVQIPPGPVETWKEVAPRFAWISQLCLDLDLVFGIRRNTSGQWAIDVRKIGTGAWDKTFKAVILSDLLGQMYAYYDAIWNEGRA